MPSTALPLCGQGSPSCPPEAPCWGGPQAAQSVLCLGGTQLFSPLWKHRLRLVIRLSEAGSKGRAVGAGGSELSLQLLAACHLPHPPCPGPTEPTLLPWAGLWEPWRRRELGAQEDRVGPPSWHPGLSLQACQHGTGCEPAEKNHLVRKGGAWLGPKASPTAEILRQEVGGPPLRLPGPRLPICSGPGCTYPQPLPVTSRSSPSPSVPHLACGPPRRPPPPRGDNRGGCRPPGAFPAPPPHLSRAADSVTQPQ